MGKLQTCIHFFRWLGVCAAHLIGWRVQTRKNPILLLGLPRSGTHWVGQSLSASTNGLLLRDPCTAPSTRNFCTLTNKTAAINIAQGKMPSGYKQYAEHGFQLNPFTRPSVVAQPSKWIATSDSQVLTPIIKEVNPFATHWFIRTFAPAATLLLVRHPAGIAMSMKTRGLALRHQQNTLDHWRDLGRTIGKQTEIMLSQASRAASVRLIRYEDLCHNPVRHFQRLYKDLDLNWDEVTEAAIEQSLQTYPSEQHLAGFKKETHKNAFAWREKISDAEYEALLEGYNLANLPDWYATQVQARSSIIKRLKSPEIRRHTYSHFHLQKLMYTFE